MASGSWRHNIFPSCLSLVLSAGVLAKAFIRAKNCDLEGSSLRVFSGSLLLLKDLMGVWIQSLSLDWRQDHSFFRS